MGHSDMGHRDMGHSDMGHRDMGHAQHSRPDTRGALVARRRRAALAIALAAALIALAAPAPASAVVSHVFKETFGAAAQPSLTQPLAMTVDPESGDLLAVDSGANENQQITFSGFTEGDRFKLTWAPPGGSPEATAEIVYSQFPELLSANVKGALEAKFGAGDFSVTVTANGFGREAFVVFKEAYGGAPQALMSCAVVAGHGSGSCSVQRGVAGAQWGLLRFKPNGEADDFSALGTNEIDGREGADETPEGGLVFSNSSPSTQLAVDRSGAATDGDIYLTQEQRGLIDVFSEDGAYLGQIDESTSNEIQKLEFVDFAEGDEFTFGNLPAACAESSTGPIPYPAALGKAIGDALAAECGANVAPVEIELSFSVEFTGAFGHKNMEQLSCVPQLPCSASTTTQGDATHNEVQRFELHGNAEVGSFSFYGLPSPPQCTARESGPIAYSAALAALAANAQAALEADCGANFAVHPGATVTATVSFVNALGLADQPQLSCTVNVGSGACAPTTAQEGGQPKPLGRSSGIAVDAAGAVYVGDRVNSLIHRYLPTSNSPYEAESTANLYRERASALAAGAGPTDGFLFSDQFGNEAVKLDSATGERQYVVDPGQSLTPAVNPVNGHLISASFEAINEYDASGAAEAKLLDAFSPGNGVKGVAVDPATGDLYVSRGGVGTIAVWETIIVPDVFTEAATGLGTEAATLNGTVNPAERPLKPDPAEGCFFEWGATAAYGNLAPCESPNAEEVGEGVSPVAVHAAIAGLKPGTTYHYRLVAANAAGAGRGEDKTLITLGPLVGTEEAREIAPTTATIAGTVDPRGEQTGFLVEYVSEADFQKSGYNAAVRSPAAPEPVGSEAGFTEVSHPLTGLAPATTYHFRLVAINATATVPGADQSFATFATPPALLPEGRAWEQVSPPQKLGEVLTPETGGFGTSCEGECVPSPQSPRMPMQAAPDGNSVAYEGQPFTGGLSSGANQYLGRRSAGGWSSEALSTLEYTPAGPFSGFKAFSADLGRAIVLQGEPALSPQAPVDGEGRPFSDLYRREGATVTPLVTVVPPNRVAVTGAPNSFNPLYRAANAGAPGSPAFGHVVFEANDALSEAAAGIAPAAPDPGPSECKAVAAECDLYEWDEGQLRLVNVLPGNEAATAAVLGSGRMLAPGPDFEGVDTDHAISADGSRIFWSDASGRVYVREDGTRTTKIPDPGKFLTASADGSKVLLDDGVLYDLEAESSTDLSAGAGGFEGILGASEDLGSVYFVDTAVLAGENDEGRSPEAGEPNLYLWREGATRLVATLSAEDNEIARGTIPFGDWKATPANRTAQVSADGRYAAFMSFAPLSGYDNDVAGGGQCKLNRPTACTEVFSYDAASAALRCASCNPTGQRPLGPSNLSLMRGLGNYSATYPQLHNLPSEGEGRLFFGSLDALSPEDTNGRITDVYEWVPDGVGECARAGGCIYLISSGHGPNESLFIDSTPTGDDVFFSTRSRLVPADKDDQLDLYDARVNGGIAEEATVPCAGEACKGPAAAAPAEPFPASAAFAGSGNLKPAPGGCPQGERKVRRHGKARCVPRHKRHHRRKHRRHAHAKRRASR
jgi:hypothetical protein